MNDLYAQIILGILSIFYVLWIRRNEKDGHG